MEDSAESFATLMIQLPSAMLEGGTLTVFNPSLPCDPLPALPPGAGADGEHKMTFLGTGEESLRGV